MTGCGVMCAERARAAGGWMGGWDGWSISGEAPSSCFGSTSTIMCMQQDLGACIPSQARQLHWNCSDDPSRARSLSHTHTQLIHPPRWWVQCLCVTEAAVSSSSVSGGTTNQLLTHYSTCTVMHLESANDVAYSMLIWNFHDSTRNSFPTVPPWRYPICSEPPYSSLPWSSFPCRLYSCLPRPSQSRPSTVRSAPPARVVPEVQTISCPRQRSSPPKQVLVPA